MVTFCGFRLNTERIDVRFSPDRATHSRTQFHTPVNDIIILYWGSLEPEGRNWGYSNQGEGALSCMNTPVITNVLMCDVVQSINNLFIASRE